MIILVFHKRRRPIFRTLYYSCIDRSGHEPSTQIGPKIEFRKSINVIFALAMLNVVRWTYYEVSVPEKKPFEFARREKVKSLLTAH